MLMSGSKETLDQPQCHRKNPQISIGIMTNDESVMYVGNHRCVFKTFCHSLI